jgi:hypothetical protein
MGDPEIVPPDPPPKPERREQILGTLVAAIVIVAVIAALGALSYVVFGAVGLVCFAIASFCLLVEFAGQVVDWMLEPLLKAISVKLHAAGLIPAIPEPIMRRIHIVVVLVALAGSALLYVVMLSSD